MEPINIEVDQHTYQELTVLARSVLRRGQRHETLDTCAVVSESMIKFQQNSAHRFATKGHFYALMAKIMRELIIDYARKKNSQMRGGSWQQVTMPQLANNQSKAWTLPEILDLDAAVEQLASHDPGLAQVMTMKMYAGLTNQELAKHFDASESTIKRDLRAAKAFIQTQLQDYSASAN